MLAHPQHVPHAYMKEVIKRIPPPPEPTPLPRLTETTTGLPVSERIKSTITVYDFVRHYVELDQRAMIPTQNTPNHCMVP